MKKLLIIFIYLNLARAGVYAANEPLIRTQTESGSFVKKTVTVKQKFYIKATALVLPPKVAPAVSTELAGRWATVDEAQKAFSDQYHVGGYIIVSAISVGPLGPDEIISGPTDTFQLETERSAPKTQRKITANSQATPAWTFVEWIGEPPPKCEIAGNSTSTPTLSENKTTTTAQTNYTWTSNWKEKKQ